MAGNNPVFTRFEKKVKSDGYAGFGSLYVFCPDYDLAVIAFTNLTYQGAGKPVAESLTLMTAPDRLAARMPIASAILKIRKKQVADLIVSWEENLGREILAENFYLDRSRDRWMTIAREKLEPLGKITSVGPIVPENQLRGTFPVVGEKGRVEVSFTLTPEIVPRVQELELKPVPDP